MKRFALTLVATIFLGLINSPIVSAEAKSGLIDGKTYSGTIASKGDKKGDPDDFEFKDGTFHSTSCDLFGYKNASYKSADKSGVITFSSTTTNGDGDTIEWNGIIKGETISGTAVRTSDKKKFDMWFHGKLKKK